MAFSCPGRDIQTHAALSMPFFGQNPITSTWLTPHCDTKKDKKCGPRSHSTKWIWFQWKKYFMINHLGLATGKSEEFWRMHSNEMFLACQRLCHAVEEDPSLKRFDLDPRLVTKKMSACGKCGVGMMCRDRATDIGETLFVFQPKG